ncbi:MAG: hypothetical protein KC635_05410 [Myxococcales bacterium]|nr:hypothetical protein [Myxococcales bacterium]MCB9732324.1 hypothetical protein [Deltaproteobacteria bacterium]
MTTHGNGDVRDENAAADALAEAPTHSWIDRYLHPRLVHGELRERHTARGIFIATLSALVALVGLLVVSVVEDQPNVVVLRVIGVALFAPILLGLRLGSLRFSTRYGSLAVFVVITGAVALSGGTHSKAQYLYTVIPFLAAVFDSVAMCVFWMGLSLIATAAFLVLDLYGFHFVSSTQSSRLIEISGFAVVLVTVLVVAISFARSRRTSYRRLREIARDLSDANGALADARAQAMRADRAKYTFLMRMNGDLQHSFDGVLGALDGLVRTLERSEHAEYAHMFRRSGTALWTMARSVAQYVESDDLSLASEQMAPRISLPEEPERPPLPRPQLESRPELH